MAETRQKIGIHSIFGSAGWNLAWGHLPWFSRARGSFLISQQIRGQSGHRVLNLVLARQRQIRQWERAPTNGSPLAAILRYLDNLMDSSRQKFLTQLSSTIGWHDADHSSWFKRSHESNAPILFSRKTSPNHQFLALVRGNYHSGDGRVEHSLAVCSQPQRWWQLLWPIVRPDLQ